MGNKNARISDADLEYLLNKTSFSRKQIKDWYKAFHKDCPEGEISRSKFLDIYSQLFPDGKAKSFYEHLFRTFDIDNSGKIDFKEFLVAISITQDGNPEDKLDLAFRLYDIDRNGAIEESEMAEIIRAIYKMVGQDADLDATKNGVTADERAKVIFKKMDENSDGQLTKDEFLKGCLNDASLYNMLTGKGEGLELPGSNLKVKQKDGEGDEDSF